MAINTACSSSLVAAHQACLSLRNQECDTALAAGVSLTLSPHSYIGMSQAGMLSPEGKCYTFDKRANGMVPGEAVAVVVLKRLSLAKSDGDPIHAVIRGSGINYDGKTNGITAPSGVAQTELLKRVYEQAKINPEDVGYIVTHGTGTKLGDPVEINALYDAFKDTTQKQNFCALTSTKTNFGHTFAASGLVSLISLVESLRYEIIPPSLHCEEENDYIHWKESPFYINKRNRPWPKVLGKNRMGAVSAFGMSGTNAHVVVQEYDLDREKISGLPPYFILAVSAKTEEALQEQVLNMATFLEKEEMQKEDLYRTSYTLFEGRHHFQYRCAIVIEDKENALYTWDQLGKESRPNLFQGKKPREFKGQKVMEKVVEDLLIENGSLNNPQRYQEILYLLADLYCQGYEIEWKRLYANPPRRIRLPTYPFAKERYWISNSAGESQNQNPIGERSETGLSISLSNAVAIKNHNSTWLHPLVHENTSDFEEQRFSSTFTGKEFFLTDHVVHGQKLLPGVGYLEMARAAVGEAVSSDKKSIKGVILKNIAWTRPIGIKEHAIEVHVGLFPEENGEIHYEIYTSSVAFRALEGKDSIKNEEVVHGQGAVTFHSLEEIPPIDLTVLKKACNQSRLSGEQCYEIYRTMGLEYGPSYRGIKEVYIGEDKILAKLSLPSCVADTHGQFVLHPSVMDSAFQASIGFALYNQDPETNKKKQYLPFALKSLDILRRCPSNAWALIQSSEGTSGQGLRKLDVNLCDESGNVCLRMKGFSSRELEGEMNVYQTRTKIPKIPSSKSSLKEVGESRFGGTHDVGFSKNFGTIMYQPTWKEEALQKKGRSAEYAEHLVMLCELVTLSQQNLKTKMNGVRYHDLQSEQKDIAQRYEMYAIQVFEQIQTILKSKPKEKILIQVVVPTQEEQQLFCGLSGLLKTAHLENPNILGQLIEVASGETEEGLLNKLQENSRTPQNNQIRYRNRKRMVISWEEVSPSQVDGRLPWKDGSVYLITGGAGGLGLIVSQEIASKTKNATLILIGRSPLSQEKQDKLREIESLGAKVEYKQVNVAEQKAVVDLVQSLQKDFGGINGIIHCAGLLRDNFILKKTKKEVQEVLAPKVSGIVNLDQASKNLPLDFFVLFSSIAGGVGNPGQADYATANAFMDAYAEYRNTLVISKERQGQTLSINWPLWEEGGMRIDEASEKMVRENTGMVAMETPAGIQAFYQALASGKSQVMVVEGNLELIQEAFENERIEVESVAEKPSGSYSQSVSISQEILEEMAIQYFKKLLSSSLKLPPHRIQAEEPLEKYGIDSIMVTHLTNQLEKGFGSLSKTLFFEYQTIKEITGYFLEAHEEKLRAILNVDEKRVGSVSIAPEKLVVEEKEFNKRIPRRSRFVSTAGITRQGQNSEVLDIAIIGLSGSYPQARDLQTYWENLREGKDCITEVPKNRWDWRKYYTEELTQLGGHRSKWGGFIEDVDKFDPLFFNISPREAIFIDPQERLFLEHAWMALEDAGYRREDLQRKEEGVLSSEVGVYAGVMYGEYQLFGAESNVLGQPIGVGGSYASIANRVSYVFNLHGPSMTIDTMCSSSLTSLHLACQDLKHGRTHLGIAGGVNVTIHPNKYLLLSNGQFISSRGRCESFGEGGDGYIPAEGVGVALLKRLADAERDGDHIYGVIKGSSVNHGGKTNGYSVPNPNAQQMTIMRALKESRIDPRMISYIEAHGTGTKLGDPIEITGLTKAFAKLTKKKMPNQAQKKQYCWIGSAKSNIGHGESAAGIAGVTKVILQMQHGQIVPSLHSQVLNPNIDFRSTPFVVNQELREWIRPVIDGKAAPRIAGISSFGAGGSNSHMIIEEWLDESDNFEASEISTQPCLIVLSAKNENALKEVAQNLLKYINSLSEVPRPALHDVAYTLQMGREAMEERLGLILTSIEELQEKLRGFLEGQEDVEDLYRGRVKRSKETLAVFAADEDLHKAMDAWISKGKYSKLLGLWVKGLIFDWNKLYRGMKPRRISLPTYPFLKKRYWISEMSNSSKSTTPAQKHISIGGTHKKKKRICIVGAGPAGLVMAKSLLEEGHQPVIYEIQDSSGGLWNLKKYKKAGAYKKTRFQTSKYTSVFSDFYPDWIQNHFYTVNDIKQYLDQYAKKFQLSSFIQNGSKVLSIQEEEKQWKVLIELQQDEEETKQSEKFDGVALCQGAFWKPKIPSIKGLDKFQGEILHSGQYYDNQIFQNKRVLVIGNGISGMDIAEEASQTAKEVFWSMRSLKFIMPRMTGHLPNDFQSAARLMVPYNTNAIIDRLKYSMPEYYALYQQSGLFPSHEDFKKHPVVYINDNIVKIVAEEKVQTIFGEVEEFVSDGCIFCESQKDIEKLDMVVFCTGYNTIENFDYVKGISVQNEFSMGIFYHKNPSLVNATALQPIAFSGTFYFPEMVSRWYAQVMSGNYQLSQEELHHRVSKECTAIIGPFSSVLFGLKLGLYPKPEEEFKEFWRLFNSPPFPMIYRLRGLHQDPEAKETLKKLTKLSLIKTDEQDLNIREVKYRLLAGLGKEALHNLLKQGEITESDYQNALDQLNNSIALDWESQYIKINMRQTQKTSILISEGSNRYSENEATYKELILRMSNKELDSKGLLKELEKIEV